MHIAFLIRALQSGGAERATVSLAGAMASRGYTVSIVTLLGADSFYTIPGGVRVVYLHHDARDSTVRRMLHLRKAVRRIRPDVLIGMSPFMNAYAVFCTCGTRIAAVGTERANPFVLYADRKTTLLRRTAALLCRGFVCQTERARSFFPAAVQRKAAVIPNAVFNPLIAETAVPPERDKTVTALGRLDHNKGFDLLLRAFAAVNKDEPQYTLTIYGEGECRAELEALASHLGIADAVSMPGAVPDAILPISRSSVFVLSSRSEGMPNALIEALAAGVPCVAADCDMGPAELIRDGENGLLVPTEDAGAIAEAVLRILRDPALSAKLSENALQLRDTLHIDRITEKWIAYLRSL